MFFPHQEVPGGIEDVSYVGLECRNGLVDGIRCYLDDTLLGSSYCPYRLGSKEVHRRH